MTVYRIFDIAMACDFQVPGLPKLQQRDHDWRVELKDKAPCQDEIDWFHSWQGPNGQEVMACAHSSDGYVMKIVGMVIFIINFDDRRILVYPRQGCPGHTLAHLLIDQVIPRALCHEGRMVLHASAVELSGGRAVAFTGLSGQGKSTLATAFFAAGHRLITDDCLLLENRGGAVYATPSYPSLRLWPDSARAIVEQGDSKHTGFSEVAHYSNKKQILFAEGETSTTVDWVKLDRLYLLESGKETLDVQATRIDPLGGMASIMALIESMFTLDISTAELKSQGFEIVRQVSEGVAVKRLAYPRDFDLLPAVMAAVNADISD